MRKSSDCHDTLPSDWVKRWHALVPQGGSCLDLACGPGRHARWLSRQGLRVSAIDVDAQALAQLKSAAPQIECICADLENDPWPLEGRQFDAVVVTNYLWRQRWPALLACLNPNGVLIYETFSVDHARIGRPSRPEFLLRHGELLTLCATLRIVAYEDGYLDHPMRFAQRIVAIAAAAPSQSDAPCRYPLAPPGVQASSADQ